MKKKLYRIICLYAFISIMFCACGKKEQKQWDLIPMVMVDGKLYMDTGYEVTEKDRTDLMDGKITSEVDGSEQPKEDNQSNFGTGYEYQYSEHEGLIEIHINDKWFVFATEEALANDTIVVE